MPNVTKVIRNIRIRITADVSGAVAVEFALIIPVFMTMIFGIFAAGILLATLNGIEQIAAGAARSSLQGLTGPERTSLATTYVASNAAAYPYLDTTRIQVSTLSDTTKNTFTVTIVYDMSGNGVYQVVRSIMPSLPTSFTRQSVVIEGGY